MPRADFIRRQRRQRNGRRCPCQGARGTHLSMNNLTLSADGSGGDGLNGGYGQGGFVEAIAVQEGALLTLTGQTTISASGQGGSGTIAGTGGDGFGGTAGLYAGIDDNPDSPLVGGTVTAVDVTMRSLGQGGSGGLGGDGLGGLAQIGTRYGSLTVTGTLFGDANGVGGNSLAGTGGSGFGGTFQAVANFAGDTGISTTNLGSADLSAVGVGGNGIGSGNAGGTAFGGLVQLISPTAGSALTATALSLHAGADGGLGGDGAIGGRGGDAHAGHALIDISAGSANLGVVSSFARGFAGAGGVGSSGAGGDGGDGFGGLVELNVTGNLAATSYLGDATAYGGDGGAGTTQGAGGSAEGGGTYFNVYTGGAAALTGAVFLNASGVRGTGSSAGGSAGGFAELLVSDTFSAGAFTASANGADAGDVLISVSDGSSADLGVGQLFALGIPGTGTITIDLGGAPVSGGGGGFFGLGLNNILLTADSLALNTSGTIDINSLGGASIDIAGHFQASAGGAMTLNDVDDTAVVRADFIDFDANSFSSSFDILGRVIAIHTVLDLDVTSTVLLAGETLTLSSNNDVIAGDLSAGLAINLFAGHDITAGDLDSGGDVNAEALNDITLGDITAAGLVDLMSDGSGGLGNIVFGDVSAGVLDFSADGTVTGGDIVAVTKATGDAQGAIALGNITVTGPGSWGRFLGRNSGRRRRSTSAMSAPIGRVGFATLRRSHDRKHLRRAAVHGAGQRRHHHRLCHHRQQRPGLYRRQLDVHCRGRRLRRVRFRRVAGAAVRPGADRRIDHDHRPGFDRPVPGRGWYRLARGQHHRRKLHRGQRRQRHPMGVLNSGDAITADAGGDLTTGNINAGGRVKLMADGNVAFADVHADLLKFEAGGTANGGNIVANTRVNGDANGAITLGSITAGPGLPPVGEASVALNSQASIAVGNVQGADVVGFAAGGDLTAGNVQAGSLLLTLVHGNVSLGSVTTAPTGRVYMANSSMLATGGGVLGVNTTNSDFDVSLVLPLAPVPTGGSITIGGPVSTGQFQAAAGDSLLAGNITAASSIEASAGDNITTGNLSAGTTVGLTARNNVTTGNIGFGQSVTLNAGNDIVAGRPRRRPQCHLQRRQQPHRRRCRCGRHRDVHRGRPRQLPGRGRGSRPSPSPRATSTCRSAARSEYGDDQPADAQRGQRQPDHHRSDGCAGRRRGRSAICAGRKRRPRGATIVINAVGANGGPDPDIIVHNVGIDGSLASNPAVSHVVVNTDASVLIDGLVLFSGASATDSLAINAGDSIQINTTNGGGIAMVNAAEDRPSGLLTLTSDNIWAGSQSLLDQLTPNVNFAGRDALVGTNPGPVVPEGYLIAGGMTLSLADTLFVQNSGAGQAYAGITVGAGGLTVVTTGAAPAQVVAYGRRMNADGTFVTGNQFFGQVDFTKATSHYTALSEFNECLINTGCSGGGGGGGGGGGTGGGGTFGAEVILGPIDLMGNPEETIEWASSEDQGQAGSEGEEGAEGEDGGSGGTDWSSQLFGTAGLTDDALVDEGVTSGGDNNQWDLQVCKPTSPDQPCPEKAPPTDQQEQ